jgi:AsmA-like C-terminal region
MAPFPRGKRFWLFLAAIVSTLVAACFLFVVTRTRSIEEYLRAVIVQDLSRRFDSQVELRTLSLRFWPRLSVTGEGLTIPYRNRPDVPPLISIETFSSRPGFFGLFREPHHVSKVVMDNMVITISHGKPGQPEAVSLPKTPSAPASLVFDGVLCKNAELIIAPRKEGKEPLDFKIHDLDLQKVSLDKPFTFRGNLTNAKPRGEIATSGSFGPLDIDEPGNTMVSGSYTFTDADLGPLPGIAGILSSTGKYQGQLDKIDVQGETDTPAFSIDPVGHGIPLRTTFSATVDGTNGETYLHPVRAVLGQSLFIANGSVLQTPEKHGRLITMDVFAPQARLQDVLALAVKSKKPLMVGNIKLKTKLVVPPGNAKAIDKLLLDGDFGVEDARFTDPQISSQLESLSRHGLGKPNEEDTGSAATDLQGHYHVENGIATFTHLQFSVEGVTVLLDGSYDLNGGQLNFRGQLRLKAELSQAVGGAKSVFLKPFDSFFKKQGSGTVIPIAITGTRENPVFNASIFHKTIKKQPGENLSGKEKK